MRYDNLNVIIDTHQPRILAEFGCNAGDRSEMMIRQALQYHPNVYFYGFDLFEDATPEINAKEMNAKPVVRVQDVSDRLDRIKEDYPEFDFMLVKGNTNDLSADIEADFVFIDGGHSIDTVRNDYEHCKNSKVIVFDDYYVGDDEGNIPDISRFGCNKVVEELDYAVIPASDPVREGGRVQFAIVPSNAAPPMKLEVKTKNCVPDEEIKKNVEYAISKHIPYVVRCRNNPLTGVMVSGGPGAKDYIKDIRRWHKDKNARIICVKHSHDWLIEKKIVPWGCILLDPRDHVQDFIENPHPDIIYFVGSMVHPTTLDRLIERKAQIRLYHAHVGAGEEDVVRLANRFADAEWRRVKDYLRSHDLEDLLEKMRPGPSYRSNLLVGGGSTSAMRGINVLHMLGFRTFRLYGYDSSFGDAPDMNERTKAGHQKNYEVTVAGEKFWTDGELVAQSQDYKALVEAMPELDIEMYGTGMLPKIHALTKKLPDISEVL